MKQQQNTAAASFLGGFRFQPRCQETVLLLCPLKIALFPEEPLFPQDTKAEQGQAAVSLEPPWEETGPFTEAGEAALGTGKPERNSMNQDTGKKKGPSSLVSEEKVPGEGARG